MSKYSYTENDFEQGILELFTTYLHYTYHHGPDLELQTNRDLQDACIPGRLAEALRRINPDAPAAALQEAERMVHETFSMPLLPANIQMTDWMQNGLDVSYRNANGQIAGAHVRLIDYEQADNNTFEVVNQWTVVNGLHTKRADIVVFINGLPVSVIELKSPSRQDTDFEDAYLQLQNYQRQVPQLFVACQVNVISDSCDTRVGTITAPLDRYMEWKTRDGLTESHAIADFDTPFLGIFNKHHLLTIIEDFTLTMGTDRKFRILAGYHQFYAVKRAWERTAEAMQRKDGRIGVFWHTQGSGKSLSMVLYVHQLLKHMLSTTVLVLTDRLDLNDQLHATFAACSDYLRQQPIKVRDGEELYDLLEKRHSHGIIFANIQKFSKFLENSRERSRTFETSRAPSQPFETSRNPSQPFETSRPITSRSDIIVISDEAHRSQSSIRTKVDTKTGELKIGFGAIVHKLLPNASFIGFTGTPIELADRDTQEVFGNYIDIYDMTQAVEDGATVPVYYESRLIKLQLDAEATRLLDAEYEKLADEGAEEEDLRQSKMENSRLRALLQAPATIDTLCRDIIEHYERNRANHLTGKAMIVALDRPTGIDIYKRLIELRPGWKEAIGVVMTQGNQDPAEWNDIIGSAARKEQLAREFKDNKSRMKFAIVVDMWLTGFDVPSLATMYVYKPMKGHNLMQAIARVNRVFPEKAGGLVVDYIGIAQALKNAMKEYTQRDQDNYGDQDIKHSAYETFRTELARCKELIESSQEASKILENSREASKTFETPRNPSKPLDISLFATCSNLQRSHLIRQGVDRLLQPRQAYDPSKAARQYGMAAETYAPYGKPKHELFLDSSKRLAQAVSICRSVLSETERYDAAYMEALRTLLLRLNGKGAITRKIIDERINELLRVAIQAEDAVEVIDTRRKEFSLFDEQFLKDVANMKEKNLAIKMLEKLLREHIVRHGKNITRNKEFSEMLDDRLAQYLNGLISNEEVIEELLKLASMIKDHKSRGDELGLTEEEMAFYDAITRPQAVRDFYTNETLVQMTRELTDSLRNSKSTDWRQKETVRAAMRRSIKRLLRKYKYPPEEEANALETVILQCETWVDDFS